MRIYYGNDDQADERLNPASPASELSAQEQASGKQNADGVHDDTPESLADVQAREASATGRNGLYAPSAGAGAKKKSFFKGGLKNKARVAVIASILGLGGGAVFFFANPFQMLVNLSENALDKNDTTSMVMERRLAKVFGTANKGQSVCSLDNRKIKCKMGRISNHALRRLEKKGITPVFSGDTKNTGKRTGYPSKNPTHYEVTREDGKKARVPADRLIHYLSQKENRGLAARVFGMGGAFNMRLKAWTGKHINHRLMKVFGLNRRGGIVSNINKKLSISERINAFKKRIPGVERVRDSVETLRKKVNHHLGKAKLGGAAYTIARAGCVSVKLPSYMAASVAAIQLAQVMPFAMDIVLSPGHKNKAGGVINDFTAEDAETVGTLLTERTKNSKGVPSSALDSAFLLAAIGVNKSKPAPSQKFTPGYSVLTHPVVKGSAKVSKKTEEACNVIMSPAAMYGAMVANVATTAAASATIIGGLIKVAVAWTVSEIAVSVVKAMAEDKVKDVLVDIAKNDHIAQARGEELGDVLGISLAAFFSAGAAARHLPTLKQSQLVAFDQLRKEHEAFQRDMAIASLSPFDTSSKYTFLGSVANAFQTDLVSRGVHTTPLASILSGITRAPALALAGNHASANIGFSQNYCGYAADFGLEATSGGRKNTPAINMAGMPCTGITPGQAAMSTEEAIALLENEGWIDTSKDIEEGDTISDLVNSGFIKSNNPLREYIDSCGDLSTGDYLFNAAGCVVDEYVTNGQADPNVVCENGPNGRVCAGNLQDQDLSAPKGVKNPRALAAMSVFLIDFQVHQSINGEDEDDGSSSAEQKPPESQPSGATNPGGWAFPIDKSAVVTSPFGPRWGGFHDGIDLATGAKAPNRGSAIFAWRDGVATVHINTCGIGSLGDRCGGGAGNYITIDHGVVNGASMSTIYMHLFTGSIPFAGTKQVKAGELIGYEGTTGSSTGNHLHFGLKVNNAYVNPAPYIGL